MEEKQKRLEINTYQLYQAILEGKLKVEAVPVKSNAKFVDYYKFIHTVDNKSGTVLLDFQFLDALLSDAKKQEGKEEVGKGRFSAFLTKNKEPVYIEHIEYQKIKEENTEHTKKITNKYNLYDFFEKYISILNDAIMSKKYASKLTLPIQKTYGKGVEIDNPLIWFVLQNNSKNFYPGNIQAKTKGNKIVTLNGFGTEKMPSKCIIPFSKIRELWGPRRALVNFKFEPKAIIAKKNGNECISLEVSTYNYLMIAPIPQAQKTNPEEANDFFQNTPDISEIEETNENTNVISSSSEINENLEEQNF